MSSQLAGPSNPAHGRTRGATDPEVVLLADTFTTWFEPENARAAARVLEAAGFRVLPATPPPGEQRPLCLREDVPRRRVSSRKRSASWTERSGRWHRTSSRGVPIVGLEPSCLLTFRDEALVLGFERETGKARFLLFEELIADAAAARESGHPPAPACGQAGAPARPLPSERRSGVMPALESTLRLVPELEVETVASSCCGMAGAFGYEAAHYETSMAMAELDLLPAVRKADPDTIIVAGGTSCPAPDCRRSGPAGAACCARAGTIARPRLIRSAP